MRFIIFPFLLFLFSCSPQSSGVITYPPTQPRVEQETGTLDNITRTTPNFYYLFYPVKRTSSK